jgi:hypothetical protein
LCNSFDQLIIGVGGLKWYMAIVLWHLLTNTQQDVGVSEHDRKFIRILGTNQNFRNNTCYYQIDIELDKWYNKRVLIWHFTLVLIKINYGKIGDQTGLFYTTNPVFYTSGKYQYLKYKNKYHSGTDT